LLGQNPEDEKKFHDELDAVLGDRDPTFADLVAPEIHRADRERVRCALIRPAYGLGREAINDCEVGGYHVPAGTQVFAFQWVTHRDARLFRCNRCASNLNAGQRSSSPNFRKYAYFPFGAGPRVCIGASFAMMEMILVLATIGQKFRLELDPQHPVEVYPAMSLRPKDGVPVTIRAR
jgi:cytochrome P450